VTPSQQAKLGELAGRTGRTSTELVSDAIDRLLDHEAWFLQQVERGVQQMERGELLASDEVLARLERRWAPYTHTDRSWPGWR
jgi:predicted transcriptional regulator